MSQTRKRLLPLRLAGNNEEQPPQYYRQVKLPGPGGQHTALFLEVIPAYRILSNILKSSLDLKFFCLTLLPFPLKTTPKIPAASKPSCFLAFSMQIVLPGFYCVHVHVS